MKGLDAFEDSRTIVSDLSFATLVNNQLVHSARSQGAGKGLRDREACRDIREELRPSLRSVRALLEEDNCRLLRTIRVLLLHVVQPHTMGNPRCILERLE